MKNLQVSCGVSGSVWRQLDGHGQVALFAAAGAGDKRTDRHTPQLANPAAPSGLSLQSNTWGAKLRLNPEPESKPARQCSFV